MHKITLYYMNMSRLLASTILYLYTLHLLVLSGYCFFIYLRKKMKVAIYRKNGNPADVIELIDEEFDSGSRILEVIE